MRYPLLPLKMTEICLLKSLLVPFEGLIFWQQLWQGVQIKNGMSALAMGDITVINIISNTEKQSDHQF